MTIPRTQTQESKVYAPQTWKWEKKHWLLVLAVGCLVLFFFGSQLKTMPMVQTAINYLPALGSLVLVGDKLLKLI